MTYDVDVTAYPVRVMIEYYNVAVVYLWLHTVALDRYAGQVVVAVYCRERAVKDRIAVDDVPLYVFVGVAIPCRNFHLRRDVGNHKQFVAVDHLAAVGGDFDCVISNWLLDFGVICLAHKVSNRCMQQLCKLYLCRIVWLIYVIFPTRQR